MAKPQHIALVAGSPPTILHQGRGYLLGVIATTAESQPQAVTLYDNTQASGSILLRLIVRLDQPLVLQFPSYMAPRFTSGLSIDVGLCEVQVSFLGFEQP